MFRLLVISDMHIGEHAHCASMMANPTALHMNVELLESFKKLIKQVGVPINAILFPGDFTQSSKPSEVAKFDTIANEIISQCNLKHKQVYVTFGNHDSDWNVQISAPADEDKEVYFGRRYENLKKSKLIKNVLKRAEGNLYDDHYALWNDDVTVLTLNTAHAEKYDDKIKCGFFQRETLQKIRDIHGTELKKRDRFKVLMIHHHPILYPNLVKYWRDHSALQEGQLLLDFSNEMGFDVIIHGHRHAPDYEAKLNQSNRQIICFCCGSFSARLHTALMGTVSNQVHLFELTGRDTATGVALGSVKTWSFASNEGWRPSDRKHDGIEHEIRFGPLFHEQVIQSSLRSSIVEGIKKKGVVPIRELMSARDEFKYTRDGVIMGLVHSVADELNLDVRGSVPSEAVVLSRS
jgi:predicted phosphodiesterase